MGAEVDSQVAAPAEMRTPNWHRANHRSQKSADGRRRQRRPGSNEKNPLGKKKKNRLDTNRPSHGRTWPSERCDSRWAFSGGKLVVSQAGEAYDAQARGLNRKFRSTTSGGRSVNPTGRIMAWVIALYF